MTTIVTSDLPEGMRERTFAFMNTDTDEVLMFGRGTDYPCSSYSFPSVEAMGASYPQLGRHTTVMGRRDLSPDFFEASFGATEPYAADKMSAIMGAWGRASLARPADGAHVLYYILGGRARMMIGIPTRIAPIHNGYKASFHEGVLRFSPVSPFFYGAEMLTNNVTMSLNQSGAEVVVESAVTTASEMPAALTALTVIPSNKSAEMDITVEAVGPSGGSRLVLSLKKMAGDFRTANSPGMAYSRHQGATGGQTSGADFIGVGSPALRDMMVMPGDEKFRVKASVKNGIATNLAVSMNWRDCYAGA